MTYVSISIKNFAQMTYMAMTVKEQMAQRDKELSEPVPRGNQFEQQDSNPFPLWLRIFIEDAARSVRGSARYDRDNYEYRASIPGEMDEADAWTSKCRDDFEKTKTVDAEVAEWSSKNLLHFGLTEACEATELADLEGYLRGSAVDREKKIKDERDAQDEDADVEVEADDIEEPTK